MRRSVLAVLLVLLLVASTQGCMSHVVYETFVDEPFCNYAHEVPSIPLQFLDAGAMAVLFPAALAFDVATSPGLLLMALGAAALF